MKTLTALVSMFAVAFLLNGCADEATCSEGEELSNGSCVPVSTGEPVADEPIPCEGEPEVAAFGDVCQDSVDHSDCGCPAPYCAVRQGDDTGYCTQTGCIGDASVCPDGWGCLDLSVFDETLPSICTEP